MKRSNPFPSMSNSMVLTTAGSIISGSTATNFASSSAAAGTYEDIDCEAWLAEIDMRQYTETFLTNLSNDGRVIIRKRLLQIRQQDLAKMNITNFLHQKIIMEHIKLIIKHPFNSPLRKKEVLILSPDAKTGGGGGGKFNGQSVKSTNSSNSTELVVEKLESKFESVSLTTSGKLNSNSHSDEAKKASHGPRKSFEGKVDPERRRSFDEHIWNSISNMRNKAGEHTAAVDQLRSQHNVNQDGPGNLIIEKMTGAGTGTRDSFGSNNLASSNNTTNARRRRSSFEVDDESFPLNNAREKANLYGNMALEYDIMMKDMKTLQQEYLNKFRMIINCEKASIFFVNHQSHELLLFTEEDNTNTFFRIPQGSGIAGFCAETGERVNIPDAYRDPRFNKYVSLPSNLMILFDVFRCCL